MQDVDLDNIELVILIIAKNPNKISQAVNFLTRRGWPTTALKNLSQAIEFASDHKPDFVLISINHPNPVIGKFSSLLSTNFGSTCVAFAENFDNSSSARLLTSALPLKIQGQASGPNLHRSIRKILAEKLNISLDDRGQAQEHTSPSDSAVTVKGTAGDGQTIIQKSEAGATQKKGPTLIKGEEPNTADAVKSESELISTGKYTMTKKNRRSFIELSQKPFDQSGNVVMGEPAAIAAELKKSLFGHSSEVESTEPESEVEKDSVDQTTPSDEENGYSITSRRSAMGKVGQTSAQINQEGSNKQASNQNTPGWSQKQDGGHSGAVGHPGNKHGAPPGSGPEEMQGGQPSSGEHSASHGESKNQSSAQKKSRASVGPHSIIERAVQEAIREIARPGAVGHAPLEVIEQVGVFPIDSPNVPGYLVLAWPHEEKSAIEPFFKQAQIIIAKNFNKLGLHANLEPGFFVTLPQVEFASWAQESSAFFFSTAHGNEEIGVAFFATQKPIPKPRQVEDKNMYSVDLDNISTDQPVNFKVYLHMKMNKKYFLYVRNGRQLQPEQKERLEGHNVKDIYMKTIDVENLRMFLASCHLRKKIKKVG